MKTKSVIIVDNSSGVRRELESVLSEHCFFDVMVAVGSPEAAIEISRTVDPDLVIYDLPLAGSSDSQVISDLKASLPRAGIIAISLYDHYRAAALRAGADEFVSKTAPRDTLLEAIARLCPVEVPTS